MKKLLCILLFLCSPIYAEETKLDIPKYLQSISITINTGSSQGSGVIITRPVKKDKDAIAEQTNFVLTAAHVINNLRTVRTIIDGSGKTKKVVEFKNPKIVQTIIENGRTVGRLELDTKVIKFSDAENGEDLAILIVTKRDFIKDTTKFLLTDDIIPIGTKLFHVGSLLGQEGSNSMTTGIMSQVGRILSLGNSSGVLFDQSTVTAFPGSSGGGVFLEDGTHIGTLVRGAGETFNLIVPARRLNSFLKKNNMFWLLDPSMEVPLLSDINKIPIQDEAKDVEEHRSADSIIEDEETSKNDFPFLIK